MPNRIYIIHRPISENDPFHGNNFIEYQIVKVYDRNNNRTLETYVAGVDILGEVIQLYCNLYPDVYVCPHDLFENHEVWDDYLDLVETIDRGRYPTSKQYARTGVC